MLYRLDEASGNKKLVEVRDPAGVVIRRIDTPALNNEFDFEAPGHALGR
jgi:hypothetical protein